MPRFLLPALFLYALLPHIAVAGGATFEDEKIVRTAIMRIDALKLSSAHVNVSSFNRRILLTGEVPDAEASSRAAQAAAGVPNVSGVSNELQVGPIIGLATRTSDSLIASDVKLRLYHNGILRSVPIKIVVENGNVFLMGVVRRKEGETAAQVASQTRGVRRVLLEFEYLD